MIIYSSRTGNNKYIVNQLQLPSSELTSSTVVSEEFMLLTYTDGLGTIPKVVSDFMINNHSLCKGVIASGNMNFGVNLFCASADKINELYGIPIIRKLDLRGNKQDYESIINQYNKIFKEDI